MLFDGGNRKRLRRHGDSGHRLRGRDRSGGKGDGILAGLVGGGVGRRSSVGDLHVKGGLRGAVSLLNRRGGRLGGSVGFPAVEQTTAGRLHGGLRSSFFVVRFFTLGGIGVELALLDLAPESFEIL